MSEWTECTLSEVADVIPGFAFKGEHFGERGVTVVKIKDITPPTISIDGAQKVDLANYSISKLEKYKLEKGDYVVAMTGATIGKVGRLLEEADVYINQRVAKIEPKSGVDRDFVYFSLIDSAFDAFVQNNIDSHSAQENISGTSIGRYPISLPQPDEQKAIAAALSSLDDKINLLHLQNKTLEAMAEALFRQWFVEEAQEDWKVYSLGDFATHLKGNIVPAKTPDKMFHHYSLPAFDAGMRPTVEAGSEILSNKYAVKPWSILVSKLNPRFPRIWPIGDLTESDAICSTEFQVFTPKSENLFGYIYFFLRSGDAKDELTMAASGTSGSHQRVRPEDILNIKTNLPSMDLAVQYSALVMPNIRKMWANNEQIQSLEKLRDTLLPKLMSGEVRVEA